MAAKPAVFGLAASKGLLDADDDSNDLFGDNKKPIGTAKSGSRGLFDD
jgi:hypothetical protein